VWHRFDVVDRARAEFGVPVTHVVATRWRRHRAGVDDPRWSQLERPE
jgi:hypothetical protein